MSKDRQEQTEVQEQAGRSELVGQFAQAAQAGDFTSLRNLFSNAEALAAFEAADSERKTAVLAQPDVVDDLAGSGMASAVIRIMDTLETGKQAEILSARYAVLGLVQHGESAAVFRLLDGMNADQKTAVLSEGTVVRDIAREKHGGKLIKLMRTLDWHRQATILEGYEAIWGLRKYGQRRQVNAMLAGILAAQEPWLSQPAVTH